MDDLSLLFKRSAADVTPESTMAFDFEQDVTEVCREHSPKLRRILTAAVQTKRAARENTLKDIEPVAFFRLYFLSPGMPGKRAQIAARSGHSISWDNTHLSLSVHVEQQMLAPPKVQTGMTQIIYDLRGLTDMEMLSLRAILERRANAGLITFAADIRPTRPQSQALHDHLSLSIIDLLIQNSAGFDYVKNAPELQHPSYCPPPADYATPEYVLRTTKLDEDSSDGTTQVNDNIYLDQLKFDLHDLDNIAVPSYNDQKTNALIRSAQLLRMGDLSAILRLEQYQLVPRWFHVELNQSWLILKIHRGQGADLGSLQYFIGLLAKVRLGSATPDFETLVSLLMQVLTDTLLFYLLRTSISSGDFGRVEMLVGTLTMMFTGGGCSNYQTELLHFLQNLKKVWPEPFATSGRGYVGVDKNTEFNINFQKHYFASRGVQASWDLLSDLAPNTQFGEFLGAPWQGTHHTKVDCSAQIAKVKSKMQEFKLHLPFVPGRRLTEMETMDIIDTGASILRKTGIKTCSKAYTKWLNGS
ncbi:hypothetical protein DFH09DRAFT_1442822 [Mycena vulgaris]|nr:hypothetical protein DFH09DRAFT_1442822 [Mycena vulgaris]